MVLPVDGARRAAASTTRSDSSAEADQDRLPGGSELVSLRRALHELPGLHARTEVADSLDVTHERLEGRTTRRRSSRSTACARAGLARLDRASTGFQRKNIGHSRATERRRIAMCRERRSVRCRAPTSIANAGEIYAGLQLPGHHRLPRAIGLDDGRVEHLPGHQAAAHLHRDARSPTTRQRTRCSTPPTTPPTRDLMAVDTTRRSSARC
jgi:hypothetical protein